MSEPLYNINDGIHGRQTGGPYLDQIEHEEFEREAAARENAEPDFENPRHAPGNSYVSAHDLVQSYNSTLIAEDADKKHMAIEATPVFLEPVFEDEDDDELEPPEVFAEPSKKDKK